MTTPSQIEERLKQLKPYLLHEFGIAQIGYFGSFARGDYRADSDLDILVRFRGRPGWKFFDLKEFLESQLHRKVDLVTEASIRKQWKTEILNQVRFI